MYETVFKNIDDTLRKDAGCSSELDYIEQTSWLLFLKYLHDYEADQREAAKLNGRRYKPLLDGQYRWTAWAAPKGKDGKLDHNAALTGDDLRGFVNDKLFPHLAGFKQTADSPQSISYKIGEIFGEVRCKLQSGYTLRAVIDKIDTLVFLSRKDQHELSGLYENKIKNMGNAGRNGGEYYTPRPLIKAIVKVINPQIGETVYDGAAGSAGFLCEAYDYMKTRAKNVSRNEFNTLQEKTFYGKEKKSLAYVIGIMNMMLHGIKAPNITHTNTLTENTADIQGKDRVDVVLANPPFGGSEHSEIQQNFPVKTSETAYLFLQHFIKMLKAGGRCGIVIKNTFLSNTDNASIALRRTLLNDCSITAVLDLPSGVFLGTGVKTVVLFFTKGKPTKKIWYYQLTPARKLGKTAPLTDDDMADFVKKAQKMGDSDNSWSVKAGDLNPDTWDLTVSNPNRKEAVDTRSAPEIIAEIEHLDRQMKSALQTVKGLL